MSSLTPPEFVLKARLDDALSGALKVMGKAAATVKADFQGLTTSSKVVSASLTAALAPVRGIGLAFGAAQRAIFNLRNLLAGAALGSTVKVFADLELQLARVRNELSGNTTAFAKYRDGVKSISRETGKGFGELGSALREITANGVSAGDALGVLSAAAKLATAQGIDTGEAALLLTQLFTNFGISATKAGDVTDLLTKAFKDSQGSAAELVAVLGPLTSAARASGLGLEETLAVVDALSNKLGGFGKASQTLTQVLDSIRAVTPDVRENLFSRLGLDISQEQLRRVGLIQFLDDIVTKAGDSEDALRAIFGDARRFRAFFAVVRDGSAALNESLGTLKDRAGAADQAFGVVAETLSVKFDKAKQTFLSILEEIGGALAPVVEQGIGKVKEFFDGILAKRGQLIAVFSGLGNIIGKLFGAIIEAAKNGDLTQVLINAALAAVEGIGRVFLAAVPLLVTVWKTIAQVLAQTLVQTFIGSTTLALGKQLKGKGLLAEIFASVALTDAQKKELIGFANVAETLDQVIANATRRITDNRELLAIVKEARTRSGDQSPLGAGATNAQKEIEEDLALIERVKKRRAEIGQDPIQLFTDADAAAAKAQLRNVLDTVAAQSTDVFERLGTNTGEKTKAAFAEVMSAVEVMKQSFNEAEQDPAVLQSATDAGAALGVQFGKGFTASATQSAGLGTKEATPQGPARSTNSSDPRDSFFGKAQEQFNVATGENKQTFEGFTGGIASVTTQLDQLGEIGYSAGQHIAQGFGEAAAQLAAGTLKGREFFASMLQGLAQIAAQAAANMMISQLFGFFAGGVGTTAGSGAVSAALAGARGFAEGGLVPGADRGYDTVPAMLRGGEYVLTPERTREIGVERLNAILEGRYDPEIFAGIAGRGRTHTLRHGYATGGEVSTQNRRGAGSGMTPIGLLPIDNATMERWIAAGRGAFARNVGRSRGALGIGNQKVV